MLWGVKRRRGIFARAKMGFAGWGVKGMGGGLPFRGWGRDGPFGSGV